MRAPKAIVFDLDGTLVDSRADIAAACNHALVAFGRAELPVATIAGFVGDGAKKLLARAFGPEAAAAEIEQAFATFSRYYASHSADHSRWMPGAREVLGGLGSLPALLVTNKPRDATLALLDALSATALFARIVSGDDAPLKPSPEPVLLALSSTGVAPEDAWVVGDGLQDILAARAAGAMGIAVLGGFTAEDALRASGADAVLETLSELLPLVAHCRAPVTS